MILEFHQQFKLKKIKNNSKILRCCQSKDFKEEKLDMYLNFNLLKLILPK